MKKICIFCGARPGSDSDITLHTQRLAKQLAIRHMTLIYGGGSTGLMGTLADGVLANGGKVIGVIPEKLIEMEVAHTGLTEQHIVGNMSNRKDMMIELADAYIALPGGFGTLDELFEVLTNAQLKLHNKPVGLVNVNGYFDHLLAFLDHASKQGLLAQENRDKLIVADSPEALLDKLFLHVEEPALL